MTEKAKTLYDIIKVRKELEKIIEQNIEYGSSEYETLIDASLLIIRVEEQIKREL